VPDLNYLAACIALGLIRPEEIAEAVDKFLDAEVYSDRFIDILEAPLTLRDMLPSFRAYLADEDVALPNAEEAVWVVIRHRLSAIVSGEVTPEWGLRRLMADLFTFNSEDYDVGELVGLHYDGVEQWEFLTKEEQRTYPDRIRRAAMDWLDAHGEGPVVV